MLLRTHELQISIHAPHAGSDDRFIISLKVNCYFNPRSPCGERPYGMYVSGKNQRNFNPRSPCGERLGTSEPASCSRIFQSTLPMRGATELAKKLNGTEAISIHAPHAGSDRWTGLSGDRGLISIHAPHAGSDCRPETSRDAAFYFNPRSPCGERLASFHVNHTPSDFNPRSPCGERRCTQSVHPAGR